MIRDLETIWIDDAPDHPKICITINSYLPINAKIREDTLSNCLIFSKSKLSQKLSFCQVKKKEIYSFLICLKMN
jgi:hypothetical protein